MTLNKIKVTDFQSIPSAEVEIGSFTVFTGPSSSGKSAFMRAASALMRNSFTPSQVRQGCKETHIIFEIDEHVIEAVRGKSKSMYILDGEKYAKAGRTVPEVVQEILAAPMISDTEATFATQFDHPFLIADPGAVASRVLGSLTNIIVLHLGIREAHRRELEANSSLKSEMANLQELAEQLAEYEDVPEQIAHLAHINDLINVVSESNLAVDTLQSTIDTIAEKATLLMVARSHLVDVSDISSSVSTLSKLVGEIQGLETLCVEIHKLQKSAPDWDYKSVDSFDISGLTSLVSQVCALEETLSLLSSLAGSLLQHREDISSLSTAREDKQAEYDKLLVSLKRCPICNSPTDLGE